MAKKSVDFFNKWLF